MKGAPLTIGGIPFPSRIFAAPLAGITTPPMRAILRTFGPVNLFTDMIPSHLIVFNRDKLKELLYPDLNEDPRLIVQISGSHERIVGEAVEILKDLGVRFINLNMGCPARKVTGSGSGAALLRCLTNARRILEILTRSDSAIVTAKIRLGWDRKSINGFETVKLLEEVGVQAVFVHARTAKDDYSVPADWAQIRELHESARIPVIGNGDIFTAGDAHTRLPLASGVMIGRGLLGNPFLIEQIVHGVSEPTPHRRITVMLDHLTRQCTHYGIERGVKDFRKLAVKYLNGIPGSKPVKERLLHLKTYHDIERLVQELTAQPSLPALAAGAL